MRLISSTAIIAFIAIGLTDITGSLHVNAQELPADVVQKLRETGLVFRQITIETEWQRATDLSDEKIRELIGTEPGRPEFFGPRRAKYVRQGDLIYSFIKEEFLRGDTTVADEKERTFNGLKMFDGTGSTVKIDGNPMLSIYDAADWGGANPKRRFADGTYFRCIGYRVAETNGDVLTKMPAKSVVLFLLENKLADLIAVREEVIEGESCLMCEIAEADRQFRYYMDVSRNYVIRQIDEYNLEGNLLRRTKNSSFEKLRDADVWFPMRCRIDHFTEVLEKSVYPDPIFFDSLNVVDLNTDPVPESVFSLTYGPGTYVTDETHPAGRVTYQMPADAAYLDQAIAEAIARQNAGSGPVMTVGRFILLATNIVIASIAICIYRYRIRRTGQLRS